MKAVWISIALAVGIGVTPAAAEPVDGIAALVNTNVITIGEVAAAAYSLQRQLGSRHSGAELKAKVAAVYSNALDLLIERCLILDAYQKQEQKLDDTIVEARIEEITQNLFKGDKGEMLAALEKEKLGYEEWRGQVRDQVVVSFMRRMNVEQNVSVLPRDVREAYDANPERYRTPAKVKLRMISLPKTEAGKAKADALAKAIAQGADFAETAKASSEDNKRASGGDWGWIEPSSLRRELAEALTRLKPGETSRVIETDDELYLLKVEDRKDAGATPFAEAQMQIEQELTKAEMERRHKAWIARLRQNAYVKVVGAGGGEGSRMPENPLFP